MKRFHSLQSLGSHFKTPYLVTRFKYFNHLGGILSYTRPFHSRSKVFDRSIDLKLMSDKVHIEDLRVDAVIGPDSWNQLDSQQCFLTMDMHTDFSRAAAEDNLKFSLNYAVISRDVGQFVASKKNWNSLGNLGRSVSDYTLNKYSGIERLQLRIKTKTGHIRSDSISYEINKSRFNLQNPLKGDYDILHISNMKLLTLIGVFNFERQQKQFVMLDIWLPWPKNSLNHISYKSVIDSTVRYVESSSFLTVEALIESTIKVIANMPYYKEHNDQPIEMKVIKLNAITKTTGVGVSSIKKPSELTLTQKRSTSEKKEVPRDKSSEYHPTQSEFSDRWNTAFVAFGSNIGNKFENICLALKHLGANSLVKIEKMSSLFQSEPMYFKDQDVFMNGCVQISTKLSPQELLKLCKDIEYKELGRIKHFDNCPRVVDLDIIMYTNNNGEQLVMDTKDLTIPHPRLLERSFVLEPLTELISPDVRHPLTTESFSEHLTQIYDKQNKEDILWKVIPLPSNSSDSRSLRFKNIRMEEFSMACPTETQSPTLLMGIVNTTPDSFSDGNQNYLDVEEKIQTVIDICNDALRLQNQIIIDIGGCSTRPNSDQVSEEEELKRTIRVVKGIRECQDLPQKKIIISIDTYRAKVAQEAILAGADIVNDISGGCFDPEMLNVIAKHPEVAYVLSHIRGDMSSMNKLNNYEEGDSSVKEFVNDRECTSKNTMLIRTIGRELGERYAEAIRRGVARWQLLLDPGLGFAKKGKQNLEIIRQLPTLKNYSCILESGEFVNLKNIPILVGPSRKAFIGKITEDVNAKDRDFATGSLISSCIGFGANIVRVHNVADCSKAVKMADALYKYL